MGSREDLEHWDRAAERYSSTVGGPDDSFYRRLAPFLWTQLGDIRGRRVLDLGCGHGWLAAKLAAEGANVTGIDGSAALVRTARTEHPGLTFDLADLVDGFPDGHGRFDAVVSHLVLMDLPDLDRLLTGVAAALVPGGLFLFSILHPCYFGQELGHDPDSGQWSRRVTRYLRHEQRWIDSYGGHTHYHRPLSWYVEQVTGHGMAVTGLHEPPSLPHHGKPAEQWTEYERWFSAIPTMLAVACRTLPPAVPTRPGHPTAPRPRRQSSPPTDHEQPGRPTQPGLMRQPLCGTNEGLSENIGFVPEVSNDLQGAAESPDVSGESVDLAAFKLPILDPGNPGLGDSHRLGHVDLGGVMTPP